MADDSKRRGGKAAADDTSSNDETGQGAEQPDDGGQRRGDSDKPKPAGAEDSGPGTGRDAPDDSDTRDKYQTRQVGAAPLEAPDAVTQTDPPGGYEESSTNPVAAASGRSTIAGERHTRLVDEDGGEVSLDSVVDFDGPGTVGTVNARTYEEFKHVGAQDSDRRLLFPEGARVTRQQFDALKAAQEG